MNLKIRAIGNSQGVLLSKEMLDHYGLKIGDWIKVETYTDYLIFYMKRTTPSLGGSKEGGQDE